MSHQDCLICSMEDTEPAARVFADDLWAAEVAPGYEVPGWFFLRPRRHAERLSGLDDAEADALGRRARDLVTAVERATGAPAVYLMSFGENYRHFHALVVARGDDVPPEHRGGAVTGLLADGRDRAAALTVAEHVRAAYDDVLHDRVAALPGGGGRP
ncbi:HIT family protein [Angustibacter speluncae]